MKKSSTAAGASSKNLQGMLTIGLDLGDRSSWYCVLDQAGEVVSEQKASTMPKAVREVFAAMPRNRIALETGVQAPWVSRLLSELGHEKCLCFNRAIDLASRLLGSPRPSSHGGKAKRRYRDEYQARHSDTSCHRFS